MKTRDANSGFTLVEIMIVVAIIGVLAAIAMPSLIKAREKSHVTRVAKNLVTFGDAFILYSIEQGGYPPDTHNVLPPGMEEYIKQSAWDSYALGGQYNWEGPDSYPYAGISLYGAPADGMLQQLDAMLDDGNLQTGSFREGNLGGVPNGRYTYIIEE